MRIVHSLVILVLLVGVGFSTRPSAGAHTTSTRLTPGLTSSVSFEPNRGQAPSSVSFIGRVPGYTIFLSGSDLLIAGFPPTPSPPGNIPFREWLRRQTVQAFRHPTPSRTRSAFRLHIVGTSPHPSIIGTDRLPGTVNYFIGNNPRHWRIGVPTFGGLVLRGIYPGINLRFRGHGGSLEYDWIVRPGANPARIQLDVQGARVRPATGGLIFTGAAGFSLQQGLPSVYQTVAGGRQQRVPASYSLHGNRFSFRLGKYNRHQPLIIDPLLDYITTIGGSKNDAAYDVATDGSGNAYAVGWALSTDFPLKNPLQPTYGGGGADAFVTKVDPNGTVLTTTYLGGSGFDGAGGVAIDEQSNIYVTGTTNSPDFPVTNAEQPKLAGSADAFVTEFNSALNAISFSTYLGGSNLEIASRIAVDGSGNIIVTGETSSTNFPTEKAFQPTFAGGDTSQNGSNSDIFVTEFKRGGQSLEYSTFLGGSKDDFANGVSVDSAGNAYVSGGTLSTDYPTKNPAQPQNAGGEDATITRFDTTGHETFSTYRGGPHTDAGFGATGTPDGKINYVVDTGGNFGPATETKLDTVIGEMSTPIGQLAQVVTERNGKAVLSPPRQTSSILIEVLVTKLVPFATGTKADASDAQGVPGHGGVLAIALDALPKQNPPTTLQLSPAMRVHQTSNATMAWLLAVSIDPNSVKPLSTFFVNGNGSDHSTGVAADSSARAYMSGYTSSTSFGAKAGVTSGFVAGFHNIVPAPAPTPTPTPTSTSTPMPTSTPVPCTVGIKLAHKSLKAGQKQKVTVTTQAGAQVSVTVKYPNKSTRSTSGTAGSSGTFTWSFKQPGSKTTKTNHTATVTAKATCSGQSPVSASKKYSIS